MSTETMLQSVAAYGLGALQFQALDKFSLNDPSAPVDARLANSSPESGSDAASETATAAQPVRQDNSDAEPGDYMNPKKHGSVGEDAAARASTRARGSSSSSARDGAEDAPMLGTRERNRLAASKYRRKHSESVNQLQEEERSAREQHRALAACADALRFEVLGLKHELLRHGDCQCDEINGYLKREATAIGRGYSDKAG